MRVERLMTKEVATRGPGDTFDRAAQLMWKRNCGFVPVIET